MSREIKFRAWDKKKKEMGPGVNPFNLSPILTDCHRGMKNLIWMQFTGLKDKKGKEIYEGDILEFIGGRSVGRGTHWIKIISICEFDESEAKFEIKKIKEIRLDIKDVNREDLGGERLIGNIYENPELLKGALPTQDEGGQNGS